MKYLSVFALEAVEAVEAGCMEHAQSLKSRTGDS